MDAKDRITLCKFKCGNNNLPITKGRYEGIDRNARICILCNNGKTGDEFHSLLECPAFTSDRQKLIKPYLTNRPNTAKASQLFTSKDKMSLKKLAELIQKIMACH